MSLAGKIHNSHSIVEALDILNHTLEQGFKIHGSTGAPLQKILKNKNKNKVEE